MLFLKIRCNEKQNKIVSIVILQYFIMQNLFIKKYYYIIFFVFCLACKKQDNQPITNNSSKANFTWVYQNNDKSTIAFTNTSTNAQQLNWDFGDGKTSTEKNPIHTYDTTKEYTITLATYNNVGEKNTFQQKINIQILKAKFEVSFYSPSNTPHLHDPFDMRLGNGSENAMSYTWNFGDKTPISTEWSPRHIYTTEGDYVVQLIATSPLGKKDTTYSDTLYIRKPIQGKVIGVRVDTLPPWGQPLNLYTYVGLEAKSFRSDTVRNIMSAPLYWDLKDSNFIFTSNEDILFRLENYDATGGPNPKNTSGTRSVTLFNTKPPYPTKIYTINQPDYKVALELEY